MLPDISRRANAAIVAALREFGNAVAALMFEYAGDGAPVAACRSDSSSPRNAFDCFVRSCHRASVRCSLRTRAAIVALFRWRIDDHIAAEDRNRIALAGIAADFSAGAVSVFFTLFSEIDLIVAALSSAAGALAAGTGLSLRAITA